MIFRENNHWTKKLMIIRGNKGSIKYAKTKSGDWHICLVYVQPKMRGKGIAKQMLKTLIQKAKEKGIKRLWLVASTLSYGTPLNILIRLYKKFGFKIVNHEYKMCRKLI